MNEHVKIIVNTLLAFVVVLVVVLGYHMVFWVTPAGRAALATEEIAEKIKEPEFPSYSEYYQLKKRVFKLEEEMRQVEISNLKLREALHAR